MDARRQETPALLSRSSPEPLYRQLAGHLEREIASGAVKPGDRIESEGLLAERFKVSRITVRQAIEGLVKQQQLIRKQGKGTFVTAPPMRHDLRRPHGLFGSLFSQSDDASAKLLLYELQVPPEEIAAAMTLRPGKQALIFRRLYLIDNKPVALLQGWLVPEVAALPRSTAEFISTEDMMREAGIRIASSQVAIRADTAGATVGKLLRISPRSPVLAMRRTAYGEDGVAKEIVRNWFRADRYEFLCATQSAGSAPSVVDIRDVRERA
mgnify:FL=1